MDVTRNGQRLLLLILVMVAWGWTSAVAAGEVRLGREATPPVHSAQPVEFRPWWDGPVVNPLRNSPAVLSVDINWLIVQALEHSARVQAISDRGLIAETAILQAEAEFDTTAFVESKFVRTSVPTGSTLDAGAGVPRLREGNWFHNAGLRRKNQHGGRFEVAQRIGTQFSNSTFFFPEDQGNARLTLSYNQPLLNSAGRAYNNSLIVLAELDTRIAADAMSTELQDHLLSVTEAYWELRTQRVIYLQKELHLRRAQVILERLEKRKDLDSLASQIARARAAVAMRRAETIRAAAEIRNTESRIRSLVNSPDLSGQGEQELIPTQPPLNDYIPVDMQDALTTALDHRPEIDAAAQKIEAARVRLNLANNQLLPVLDVVLETYVSGLQGDFDVGQSLADQFSRGEPSYTAGLVFEVPLYRRAAKAQHQRRQIELRQLGNQFQATVETLRAEVEVSVREVDTAYRELQSKFHSMVAAESDAGYLQRRWELLPGDDRSASFLLEDLLDAQDRLSVEESGFAKSQVEYALSLTRLNRATGTLLQREQIELLHGNADCLPAAFFGKATAQDFGHTVNHE